MIPGNLLLVCSGPHCAPRPYQVYLISGIDRWNSDRRSDAVFGAEAGTTESTPCRSLTASTPAASSCLVRQWKRTSGPQLTSSQTSCLGSNIFSARALGSPSLLRASSTTVLDRKRSSPRRRSRRGVPQRRGPSCCRATFFSVSLSVYVLQEDVCSDSPLPGFQKLEAFCTVLVEVGLTDRKLLLNTEQRNRVLNA